MAVSKELLDELKQILKEEFNIELSSAELLVEFARSLVSYFDVLSTVYYEGNEEG